MVPPIRDSMLARWHPSCRLAAIASAIFFVACTLSPQANALQLLLAIIIACWARLPLRFALSRLFLLILALLPFLVIVPFLLDREGPGIEILGLRASETGIRSTLALLFRSITITLLGLTIITSSSLHATMRTAQRFYLPPILVQIMLLSVRYIAIVFEEFQSIRIAVRVRGFRNRACRHSYRTVSHIIGTLIVRGFDRSERVTAAMRCRGFHGQFHSLPTRKAEIIDYLYFAIIVACYAVIALLDRFKCVPMI